MAYIYTECPNCGSIWEIGSEEYEFQQCDSCGYPDAQEDDFDPDETYDDSKEEAIMKHGIYADRNNFY